MREFYISKLPQRRDEPAVGPGAHRRPRQGQGDAGAPRVAPPRRRNFRPTRYLRLHPPARLPPRTPAAGAREDRAAETPPTGEATQFELNVTFSNI